SFLMCLLNGRIAMVEGTNVSAIPYKAPVTMNFSRCLLFALLAAATVAAAKDNPADVTVQQKYRAGGSIHMQLESGDYSITGADSENITITYRAGSAEQTRGVKVNIRITDSE